MIHNILLKVSHPLFVVARIVYREWIKERIWLKPYENREFYHASPHLPHLLYLNRNQKRLLHPGADTKLILSQYVATIKCLRIIDPPGVLLFKVADPIRRYLRFVISLTFYLSIFPNRILPFRERPDTIRSIVANLVGDDDSGDSLVDENEPIQPLQQLEVEDYTDPNWEPEPIDAGPGEFLNIDVPSRKLITVPFFLSIPHKQTKRRH